MTVKEVILAAIDILKTEGWVQFTTYRPNQGYCALGAVYKAADDIYQLRNNVYSYIQKYMKENKLPTITAWNDQVGRTKEDVIDLLTKIAETVKT